MHTIKAQEMRVCFHRSQIIDCYNFKILDPINTEKAINNMPGVVCNGVFALNPATSLLLATNKGVQKLGA